MKDFSMKITKTDPKTKKQQIKNLSFNDIETMDNKHCELEKKYHLVTINSDDSLGSLFSLNNYGSFFSQIGKCKHGKKVELEYVAVFGQRF